MSRPESWKPWQAENAPSMDVLYVAGPFSALTPEGVAANVAEAVAFGQKIRELGALPLVPHVAVVQTEDYEAAMKECFEMIRRADAVILMPKWHLSPGAVREHYFAKTRGMVVFESLEAYRRAANFVERRPSRIQKSMEALHGGS